MYVVWALLIIAECESTGRGVVNPARGRLNRKCMFSLSSFAPGNNLVSRDRFGGVFRYASACSFSTLRSRNCVLMAFVAESPPREGP